MRGIAGKVCIAVGIVLVLGAVLWWAIAVNALVKIPKDVDTMIEYEGLYTWYINPVTFQPLPEGGEQTLPMKVRLNLLSENDQYDSSTAVISGSVETEVGGVEMKLAPFAIVLDRKTCENKADDRAYVLTEELVVDRSGSLSYTFPFGTSKDERYRIWKEEIGAPMEGEFIGEEEKQGLAVYNFKCNVEGKEVVVAYVEFLGLPTTLDFDQFKDILKGMGIDVDGLLALAQQRLSTEDQQALSLVLSQEIPLKCYWNTEAEYSVEPKSGVIVDGYKTVESTTVKPDPAGLANLASVLMKYQQDPVLGPALQQLTSLAPALEEYQGQRLVKYEFKQTEESVGKSIEDAKKGRDAINLVKVYIPISVLVIGLLALITGLLLAFFKAGPRSEHASEDRGEAEK